MYPISKDTINLFADGGLQKAKIAVFPKSGGTYELTEADVCTGGLSVDRYSTTGQKIEVGSAISSELTLTLRNDGRFNDKEFQGAEMFVQVGIRDWVTPRALTTENHAELQTELGMSLTIEEFNRLPEDTVYTIAYIPLGWFKVDSPPRALSTISMSALDRMMRFDKYVDKTLLHFPCTVSELLLEICRICDVLLADNAVSKLTNADYEIAAFPEQDKLTYRTLLIWIAQITGTCAYMDWDGRLRLEWYGDQNNAIELDETMRYSSDLQEQFITVTGIEIHANETVFQSKVYEDTYVVSIEGNLLLQGNEQAVADALGSKLVGFRYIPFEAKTTPMPFLFPMDSVDFVKNGLHHKTVLTNINYTLNGSTSLSAKGETEEINNLPTPSSWTPKQSSTIKEINQNVSEVRENLTTQEKATQYLNQTAATAMGMYYSERSDENGGVVRYWHDAERLENSAYICMQNSGGSFSTNTGWNNGSPNWTEGTDKFGNAIVSLLNTIGIRAEWIRADSITTDKLSIGQSERGTNLIQDSSFESNSLCVPGTYDEANGSLIMPGHNDYWNAVTFTASEDYDIAYSEFMRSPSVGGFDGNKSIMDCNFKGLAEDEELWFYGVEQIEPIPIEMISHTVSFYCRVKKGYPNGSEIAHAKYAFKIQWLDGNQTPTSATFQSFDVNSDGTENWQRRYAVVTPPNGAKYARFAIGFICTDLPILLEDDYVGGYGYPDLAFLDLDGILFEQGTDLNAWTCSESEVSNTGVLINSNGLNISDGKICITDPFGRRIFYLDGSQSMQLLGGLITEIFDPLEKKLYARATMQSVNEAHTWDESGELTGSGFLGMAFEEADANGQLDKVGHIGMQFAKNYDYPMTFFSKHGFAFNGVESALISEPQVIPSGANINNINYRTPGWYYCATSADAKTITGSPTQAAFCMRVEKIAGIAIQTITSYTLEEYKRYYQNWDPVGWKTWKKCF